MASIGLDPINAVTALGIQSKAVLKYTKLFYRNLIQIKGGVGYFYRVYLMQLDYVRLDFFNQLFHIIIDSHV
ncbi:MAG: hypothetical protein GYB55_19315 [Cytophagales bacterium]|nr:hypothetical protein [Cytophagales bacterium]